MITHYIVTIKERATGRFIADIPGESIRPFEELKKELMETITYQDPKDTGTPKSHYEFIITQVEK